MLTNIEKTMATNGGIKLAREFSYDKFISLYKENNHTCLIEALNDYIDAYYQFTLNRHLNFSEFDEYINLVFMSALDNLQSDLKECKVFINE